MKTQDTPPKNWPTILGNIGARGNSTAGADKMSPNSTSVRVGNSTQGAHRMKPITAVKAPPKKGK